MRLFIERDASHMCVLLAGSHDRVLLGWAAAM